MCNSAEAMMSWRERLPPVSELTSEELGQIVTTARAKPNAFTWTAREKEAWSELANRSTRKQFRS